LGCIGSGLVDGELWDGEKRWWAWWFAGLNYPNDEDLWSGTPWFVSG